MIVVKNRNQRDRFIDKLSQKMIRKVMEQDCPKYFVAKNCPARTWIARTIFYKKKIHEKSTLTHGFFLRYKFRKNDMINEDVFDIGIIEVKIPEDVDELLDMILLQRERTLERT